MLQETSNLMAGPSALTKENSASHCLDHLHFGPGKLGLGLIVPMVQAMALSDWQIKTTLLARKDSSRPINQEIYNALKMHPRYDLTTIHTGKRESQSISAIELLYFDSDHELLIDRATQPNPMLITTSVGSGLPHLIDPITKLLAARLNSSAATAHCIVIACENLPLSSTGLSSSVLANLRRLKIDPAFVSEHVTFADALVDRICPREIHYVEGNYPEVETEKYGRWIVSNSDVSFDRHKIVRTILRSPVELEESQERFRFLERRKLWLVNGTHVALATESWVNGIQTLRDGLETNSILEAIIQIQEVFSKALASWADYDQIKIPEANVNEIRVFAQSLIQRILEGPEDLCRRIIGDWLKHERKQEEWSSLLSKVVLRVVEPSESLVGDSGSIDSRQSRAVISLLTNMIKILAKAAAASERHPPATLG